MGSYLYIIIILCLLVLSNYDNIQVIALKKSIVSPATSKPESSHGNDNTAA